jgi:hypothetical protein
VRSGRYDLPDEYQIRDCFGLFVLDNSTESTA